MTSKDARVDHRENLNAILNALTFHLEKAHQLIDADKLDPRQYEELAIYVSTIRSLLKELLEPASSPPDKATATTIQRLRQQYLELEGLVKERRNDLVH